MRDLNQSFEQFRRAKHRAKHRREYEQAKVIEDPAAFAEQILKHLGCKPQWMRAAKSICVHGSNVNKIENVARIMSEKTCVEWFGERPEIPRVEKLATRKRTLEMK